MVGAGRPSPVDQHVLRAGLRPDDAGEDLGAFSNVHDIPNANIITGRHGAAGPGGVCVSTDFGATWKVAGQGLPKAPALSVVVDAKSPAGSRTLYASVFVYGVFKSADDGKTWQKASQGLGSPEDLRVCRLQLHSDGSLFVVVTALRQGGKFVADGPGLYRSKDGAKTWEIVNKTQPLLWPKDFTVDPKDSRIIFVGAADAGDKKQGGLYRTTRAYALRITLLSVCSSGCRKCSVVSWHFAGIECGLVKCLPGP